MTTLKRTCPNCGTESWSGEARICPGCRFDWSTGRPHPRGVSMVLAVVGALIVAIVIVNALH